MYTIQEITLSQILAAYASAKIEGGHVVLITIRKQTQARARCQVKSQRNFKHDIHGFYNFLLIDTITLIHFNVSLLIPSKIHFLN